MTNVSDVLEPRECRQSSPLRSSFLLVPFSDASYTESRASSPALFQGLYTMCRYHCLIQTTPLRCAHSVSYLASGGILGRARWKHVRMRAEQAIRAQASVTTIGEAQA
ncbi:hypothetical protein L227DRAFT_394586 [Lentinus tigrinus ALCF2SS1-6]|uniref:Uncharacterized protein n=1 Tax=Lentinus tigrinus ALCF2SS1-6 TaxID=1328759 RepID=A0A5C2SKB8_9APHY|nr:hypothetical protein L227DRAFT_394586 [Lentinus tigrinus ALCF2SS1-6]